MAEHYVRFKLRVEIGDNWNTGWHKKRSSPKFE